MRACTARNTYPFMDLFGVAVGTGAVVVGATTLLSLDDDEEEFLEVIPRTLGGSLVLVGVLAGVTYGASADWGFSTTASCRRLIRASVAIAEEE